MKIWSKIRLYWYKLLRKDVRWVFVPTESMIKHSEYMEKLVRQRKTGDFFNSSLEQPPKLGESGIWIIDKRNFVKDMAGADRKASEQHKTYKVKEKWYQGEYKIKIRQTIIDAINQSKTIH